MRKPAILALVVFAIFPLIAVKNLVTSLVERGAISPEWPWMLLQPGVWLFLAVWLFAVAVYFYRHAMKYWR